MRLRLKAGALAMNMELGYEAAGEFVYGMSQDPVVFSRN
jgi:hypothetical protein